MSPVHLHAFYWGWASTDTRSRYRARYRALYQNMVVCDTTVEASPRILFGQTWLLPSQNVRQGQLCKIKVARECFVLGFRLYRIGRCFAFLRNLYDRRSPIQSMTSLSFRNFSQLLLLHWERLACFIWLIYSEVLLHRHIYLLVSKLLAHDSIFKQLYCPSHSDKSKHKHQKEIYMYTFTRVQTSTLSQKSGIEHPDFIY